MIFFLLLHQVALKFFESAIDYFLAKIKGEKREKKKKRKKKI